MIRILSFIVVIFCAFLLPWWVFLCVSVLYVLAYTSYELLALAVCVDAVFGDPQIGVWYVYTLTVSVLLIALSCVKPYLRIYP